MAGVYSTCFMDSAFASLPGIQTYTVPLGFIGVLRNININCNARAGYEGNHGPPPFQVTVASTGTVIFQISSGTIQNRMYYWEGREVIGAGQSFATFTGAAQFQYRLNGFLLKSP